ncbi:MAG: AAA family ATPase [Sulfurimonas sp.]|nr:AAA family ATPase [Sulfurimonas sp.]MDD3060063.1 AAA family ATPase [Sulfurimonas sp.]MDD5203116.1 AAA family ATPase [Sulfurimonas sp.]
MSEEVKIKNEEYFKQIVKEFKEACKNETFDLVRNYKTVSYENEVVELVDNIKTLTKNEFHRENFVTDLYKILRIINKNFWGLNFLNLGFKQKEINEIYGNYEKTYSDEQWKKLYSFLKQNCENKQNDYYLPEENFIYGYGSTATVTPLLHLMDMERFPVINSVYVKLIKDFFGEKVSTSLSDYGVEKEKVLGIAKHIKEKYFNDYGQSKELQPSELLDRLAFFYAQKQSSAVSLKHKNIIYYGPPGTGKTYSILETVNMLTEGNKNLYKMVQFHPSYSYEDFIEGIKPSGMDNNGNIKFDLVDGEFKKFCIEAMNDRDNNYYFIIDEINRAELSRVFGEILFCIEYRLPSNIDGETKGLIRTPYATLLDEKLKKLDEVEIKNHVVYWNKEEQKSYFGIPENVFVIGTMNDVDRSIDSFDLALRRRFRWEYMNCDDVALKNHLIANQVNESDDTINVKIYIQNCKNLNKYIAEDLGLGKSYKIGHAYFMKVTEYLGNKNMIKENSLKQVWENHIEPLLFEYFRSEYDEVKAEEEMKKSKDKFIPKEKKVKNDTDS